MSQKAIVRVVLVEDLLKLYPTFEMTNKNSMPIKKNQNVPGRVHMFAVTFRVVGMKNSGFATAILEKVSKLNYYVLIKS